MNGLFDPEGREGYLSFLVKESWCIPRGGMEGVCRLVITVQNLMGWEFSLSTKWILPLFEELDNLSQCYT